MQIIFQKSFQKDFAKCTVKVQSQTQTRIELFINDRFNPLLNFHALKGEYMGCFSINVNADVRALFFVDGDTIYLIRVGSHAQLYG